MSLLAQIQADLLAARRAQPPRAADATFLSTLYAEAARVGKDKGNRESTDSEVVEVARGFVNSIDATLTALGGGPLAADPDAGRRAKREALMFEKVLAYAYIPESLSAAELDAAIEDLVAALPERHIKHTRTVLAGLAERFGDRLDKRWAGQEVTRVLKG